MSDTTGWVHSAQTDVPVWGKQYGCTTAQSTPGQRNGSTHTRGETLHSTAGARGRPERWCFHGASTSPLFRPQITAVSQLISVTQLPEVVSDILLELSSSSLLQLTNSSHWSSHFTLLHLTSSAGICNNKWWLACPDQQSTPPTSKAQEWSSLGAKQKWREISRADLSLCIESQRNGLLCFNPSS